MFMFLLALHNNFSKFKLQTVSKMKMMFKQANAYIYLYIYTWMTWYCTLIRCVCLKKISPIFVGYCGHENKTHQAQIFTWMDWFFSLNKCIICCYHHHHRRWRCIICRCFYHFIITIDCNPIRFSFLFKWTS